MDRVALTWASWNMLLEQVFSGGSVISCLAGEGSVLLLVDYCLHVAMGHAMRGKHYTKLFQWTNLHWMSA
jgi:hypothetical protein